MIEETIKLFGLIPSVKHLWMVAADYLEEENVLWHLKHSEREPSI